MATYLDLVQAAARESGTVAPGTPASVIGLTGRLAKFAAWVSQAWSDIQNHRDGWRWMQDDVESALVIDQQRYTGSDLGLTRFGSWRVGEDSLDGDDRWTIWRTAEGQGDERPLTFRDWPAFRSTAMRGSAATTKGFPQIYSVDPQERIVVYPIPDMAYTIKGLYRKSPQVLTANGDTPEMPARFHDLIVWWALIKVAGHDESMAQPQFWQTEILRLLNALERDQLPPMRMAGALA